MTLQESLHEQLLNVFLKLFWREPPLTLMKMNHFLPLKPLCSSALLALAFEWMESAFRRLHEKITEVSHVLCQQLFEQYFIEYIHGPCFVFFIWTFTLGRGVLKFSCIFTTFAGCNENVCLKPAPGRLQRPFETLEKHRTSNWFRFLLPSTRHTLTCLHSQIKELGYGEEEMKAACEKSN